MATKNTFINERPSGEPEASVAAGASAGASASAARPAGTPADETAASAPARAKRGFAVLSPEKKREIARMGGKAAHQHGRAHRFTSEEARAAGKKRHQMRMMAAAAAAQALAAQGAQPPQPEAPQSAGVGTAAATPSKC